MALLTAIAGCIIAKTLGRVGVGAIVAATAPARPDECAGTSGKQQTEEEVCCCFALSKHAFVTIVMFTWTAFTFT